MTTPLYRITSDKYLNVLNGQGASFKSGARWNPPGSEAIYMGVSAAGAMLEMGNYIPLPSLVPDDYVMGIFSIPSQYIDTYDITKLPVGWDEYPHSHITQEIGKEWLDSHSNVCIRFPSCTVPSGLESIVLINPNHPDIKKLQLIDKIKFNYHERLFNGLR